MAATLKAEVQIATDQATGALKSLSSYVNQAGAEIKRSLATVGPSSAAASEGLIGLKKEAGRARETMMFLTQSLGELGPQGRTAQVAISGIAGALIGGGGLVLALGLAQAAIRIYTEVTKGQAEADKAAAEAAKERAKQLRDVASETERINRATAGETPEMIAVRERLRDVDTKAADIRARLAAATEKLAEIEARYQGETAEFLAAKATRDEAAAELAYNERLRGEELRRFNAAVNAATERERIAALKTAAADQARADKEALAAREKHLQEMSDLSVAMENRTFEREYEVEQKKAALEIEMENRVFEREYENAEKLAEQDRKRRDEGIARAQQWGAALGDVFGQLATGQMTAEQAAKSILGMLIKEATAAAIAMAIQAGKSQAGVPVVGPVLAIAAMGAVLTAALAKVGSMPSARGGWWDTGNYSGLAMIHEREMVLPAREAAAVRRGAGGMTINVSAYDGRGFDRVLSNNQGALARALRGLDRRGGGR